MQFKSKAQAAKIRDLEDKGIMQPGTYEKGLAETPDFDDLPERIREPREQNREF